MTDSDNSLSLFEVATEVDKQINRFKAVREGSKLTADLRERLGQVEVAEQTSRELTNSRKVLLKNNVGAVRIPKKKIKGRCEALKNLEEGPIQKLVERDALNLLALQEALGEARDALVELWKKFSQPPRESNNLEALASEPETQRIVQKVRELRQQLSRKGDTLPTTASDVETVQDLQKELAKLGDQIRAKGYGDNILQFLQEARSDRGISLAAVLKDQALIAWLKASDHGKPFRVVHESNCGINRFGSLKNL
ncbi:MAG TPA: hypothetical protein VG938_00515 [Verrucomicrobiae bacterium]|jgi:hypothetical protein|nr:hypothetical protein [Verrucomicrobiae bacterium]